MMGIKPHRIFEQSVEVLDYKLVKKVYVSPDHSYTTYEGSHPIAYELAKLSSICGNLMRLIEPVDVSDRKLRQLMRIKIKNANPNTPNEAIREVARDLAEKIKPAIVKSRLLCETIRKFSKCIFMHCFHRSDITKITTSRSLHKYCRDLNIWSGEYSTSDCLSIFIPKKYINIIYTYFYNILVYMNFNEYDLHAVGIKPPLPPRKYMPRDEL